jgi:hypothetical protein
MTCALVAGTVASDLTLPPVARLQPRLQPYHKAGSALPFNIRHNPKYG